MSYIPIDSADHQAGKPVVGAGGWAEQIAANLDYLFGVLGTIEAGDIPNGSFEIDSDADGVPDNWVRSLYPGGTGARDVASPAHGAACIKLTHPGGASNGGGDFTSDYVACSPSAAEIVGLIHWATAAGMHNLVQVAYYTAAKVPISTDSLYDSVVNPTTPTQLLLGFTPPATARFYKLILTGGKADVDVAGSAYFDGLTKAPGRSARWLSAIADATLAEQTTSSGSWVDAGSFIVTVPHRGLPVVISFVSELKGGEPTGGEIETYALQRFRIGTDYSSANSVVSPLTYVPFTNTISIAPVLTSGQLTIVQQLLCGVGAWGRKAAADTRSHYLAEEV